MMQQGMKMHRAGKYLTARTTSAFWWNHERLMTAKAPNRAAVHGTKLPVTETLVDKEEVEREINKGKEEKERRRKEIEQADSHINQLPQVTKPPTS